ncbi:hypothetical protein GCM10009836_67680 [Pseudonocardia ailaonensis]|uniref:AbiEi antitoxin C-terminal domain-containing protein n=1 Tax=Pseudonocardia ailaonensis TaxID=367279 RepID=A0ABN2NR73_9PSEU
MLPWELGVAGACRRSVLVDAVGEHSVRSAVRSRAALSPWPGVLVDAGRATDPWTSVTAAWLLVGEDSVVAGPTAAHLLGCAAAPLTPVHLAVTYETRRRSRPGLFVHNGLALADDTVPVNGLPLLRLERVVCDVLCTVAPGEALVIADQALASVVRVTKDELRSHVLERDLAQAFRRRGVDLSRRVVNGLRPRRHRDPRSA